MMVFSTRTAFCWVTLTLGILIAPWDRASADVIVQTVDYQYQLHGTTFGSYNQFDPSLGTLLSVTAECQGSAAVGTPLQNETSVAQSFTGSVAFYVQNDGGLTFFSNSITGTLPPYQPGFVGASGSYDLTETYGSSSFWVGTGTRYANEHAGGSVTYPIVSLDNPNILVLDQLDQGAFYADRGFETVTYTYQAVPEPPAYLMLGTTCLGLLSVRYFLGTRNSH